MARSGRPRTLRPGTKPRVQVWLTAEEARRLRQAAIEAETSVAGLATSIIVGYLNRNARR